MIVEAGTYTGNGTSKNVSLSEIGGTPDFVLVKADSTYYGNFWITGMSAPNSERMNSLTITTGITAVAAGQFSVGAHNVANANGVIYNFIAIYDDGNGDFDVGTYVGDGSDDVQISGLGFEPECVWVTEINNGNNAKWHAECMGASTDTSADLCKVPGI